MRGLEIFLGILAVASGMVALAVIALMMWFWVTALLRKLRRRRTAVVKPWWGQR